MYVPNIKIVLSNGNELDYQTPESLGIKFNRVVEDFQDPSKRFGEYTYTVNLPITKKNRTAFEFPDVRGRDRVFVGKQYSCRVFNGSELLLDGMVELIGFDKEYYKCQFNSKYTQLLDSLKGKKLVDMTALPTIVWDYENTISAHITANYNSDQTDYQFPFIFYKTPFMSGATGTEDWNYDTKSAEYRLGYYYNYISTGLNIGRRNPRYYTSFPPAIYLRSIMKGMFKDAGWSLTGTFFDGYELKNIIIPFVGSPEDFSGSIITGGTNYLNLNKCLPDINQIDFLRDVINAFNLYFTIDPASKQISFDTYTTYFGGATNPYDLTGKLDDNSINILSPEAETKITFADDDSNNLVAGYGRLFDYGRVNAGQQNPTYTLCLNNDIRFATGISNLTQTYDKNAFGNVFNKTTGEKEIKLNFSAPNYYSYVVLNDRSFFNDTYSSAKYPTPAFVAGIPLISQQTPQKSFDNAFADDLDQDYCAGNAPDRMAYDGGLKMMYYYGQMSYNFPITGSSSTTRSYNDWAWFGLAAGGTCSVPGMDRLRIPVASPFMLLTNSQLSALKGNIASFTTTDKFNERGAEAHYLLATYHTAGKLDGSHTPTRFSLTFGDSGNLDYPNLYTFFHEPKYMRIRNGYVLEGDMIMNSNDWREMQINRTLMYDGQYYQLLSIKNYDPVRQTASIQLLKK